MRWFSWLALQAWATAARCSTICQNMQAAGMLPMHLPVREPTTLTSQAAKTAIPTRKHTAVEGKSTSGQAPPERTHTHLAGHQGSRVYGLALCEHVGVGAAGCLLRGQVLDGCALWAGGEANAHC
jgi:hypothetical protein